MLNNPNGPGLLIPKHPDPKKHQTISFVKSIVRIIGYVILFVNVPVAACVLVFSELIGIFEELV